jgi:hypothetical protein
MKLTDVAEAFNETQLRNTSESVKNLFFSRFNVRLAWFSQLSQSLLTIHVFSDVHTSRGVIRGAFTKEFGISLSGNDTELVKALSREKGD